MALQQRANEAPLTNADQREAARLAAVDRLHLLDTPPEPEFDDIVRLIRQVFGVKVAIVSLFDAHRQWYKACEGLTNTEVARQETFCRYVLDDRQPMVIPDARRDPRFADNPNVTGEPHVRFYAGVPLIARAGEIVGTVCAIDFAPREFDDGDLKILEGFAALAMRLMEMRSAIVSLKPVEPPTINHAAQPRRRVLKAGQIIFFNRMSTIDCTVRSLGPDSAGLEVSSTAGLPSEFTSSSVATASRRGPASSRAPTVRSTSPSADRRLARHSPPSYVRRALTGCRRFMRRLRGETPTR